MEASDSRRRIVLLALVVAFIAIVPFLPALHGGWILDDHQLIEGDPYVHALHWFTRWFTTDFWAVNPEIIRYHAVATYWRPLIMASYALDWHVGGGAPLCFHITNFAWHGLAAGLAFVVLRRWVGATWPAFVAAVLFAIHPTKSESVAWISGRTDVICMVFVLLASEGIGRRLRGARGGLALEIAGTIGAYMSKEQAIVLPVFAAVETWVALGRPAIDRSVVKRLARSAVPQAIIAVGYVIARAAFLPIRPNGGAALPLHLLDHAAMVLESIGRFVALTFAPHALSIQHALVHIRHGRPVHDAGYVALGAIALAALLAAAWAARRRWPVATIGITFYLATLAPTMNLKYIGLATLVSERFLYLPVLGLALVIGAALAASPPAWRRRGYALATAGALALTAIGASRAADFRDEPTFWARELRLHPSSLFAHAFVLQGQVVARHFKRALQLIGDTQAAMAADDPDIGSGVAFATKVVFVLEQLTPDHDVAALHQLDRFCRDLLEDRIPQAQLHVGGVNLTIRMQEANYRRKLNRYIPDLESDRASIASRLGDDDGAIRHAALARAACQWCEPQVITDAIVHARAGQYDAAFAILDATRGHLDDDGIKKARAQLEAARGFAREALAATGPAKVAARAHELAKLELWGRAYEALAPYEAELIGAPNMVRTFAELAYRAGEPAVARDALVRLGAPPDVIRGLFEGWAEAMGWGDEGIVVPARVKSR